jgi:hypothetical protein
MLALPLAAAADHGTREHTKNIHAQGHSPHPASFLAPDGSPGREVNSDIAFWENYVFHGNYNGFRILQEAAGNPHLISHTRCNGDQGDIVVWENILVRSWNSKKGQPRDCDDTVVPGTFEGVHVFDTSDVEDPVLVGQVRLNCGSHTVTVAGVTEVMVAGVPTESLIVWSNNSSSAGCDGGNADGDFMDIIAVPLNNPAAAFLLRREELAGPINPLTATGCHDAGVIHGEVNLAACASADSTNLWSIGPPRGGTIVDPLLLRTIQEPGVCSIPGDAVVCNGRWHSAAFTWDGEAIILGWEPGGGAAPECEASDPPVKKSAFIYDVNTGAKLGQWTLPRPQSSAENCTIHNYNPVPLKDGRDVLIFGNYQAGTWAVDITDRANPETIGWSDPPPIVPTQLGGAWSTYWYNGHLWESEIQTGMNVFRLSGGSIEPAVILEHLNPQTQEFSLD